MPAIWSESILAEVKLAGGAAQVVESHYERGATNRHFDTDVSLRCRLTTGRSKVRSWQAGSPPSAPGRMILNPPQVEAGGLAQADETFTSLALRIKSDWLEEISNVKVTVLVGDPQRCIDFQDMRIEASARRMAEELLSTQIACLPVIDSLFTLIAIDLVRHFSSPKQRQEPGDFLTKRRIERVQEIVSTSSGAVPSSREIARTLQLNHQYLGEIFKSTTGKSLYTFLAEERIRRAKLLLLNSDARLKIIAHELGYSSPAQLAYAFRKHVGESPAEYRARRS